MTEREPQALSLGRGAGEGPQATTSGIVAPHSGPVSSERERGKAISA